jgi:heat shock protein HslJ
MTIHHLRLASVGLVALAAVLTGCGEEHVQGFLDPGAPADPVGGEYVGDGPVRLFPDGSEPIRLTLRGGEISFTAGCNHFSGRATWHDGVLRTSELGGTEMGCLGSGQEQDEWMIDFFGSSPTLELDGTDVAVRSEADTVWFVPADEVSSDAPGDAADLVGTQWQLTGIGERDGDSIGMMVIPDDVVATIRFEDKKMEFEDGCNAGGGSARVSTDAITFGRMATTLKYCPGAAGEVERGVSRVLQGKSTVSWSIAGDELRLVTRDGRHELVYHR